MQYKMTSYAVLPYNYINPLSHFLHATTTGRVTYQSRYLRSETYRWNMAANRIVVSLERLPILIHARPSFKGEVDELDKEMK